MLGMGIDMELLTHKTRMFSCLKCGAIKRINTNHVDGNLFDRCSNWICHRPAELREMVHAYKLGYKIAPITFGSCDKNLKPIHHMKVLAPNEKCYKVTGMFRNAGASADHSERTYYIHTNSMVRAFDLVDVLLDAKPDTKINITAFGGYSIHKDS